MVGKFMIGLLVRVELVLEGSWLHASCSRLDASRGWKRGLCNLFQTIKPIFLVNGITNLLSCNVILIGCNRRFMDTSYANVGRAYWSAVSPAEFDSQLTEVGPKVRSSFINHRVFVLPVP